MLTQQRLKEVLHYDPNTGEWRWLVKQGRVLAGSSAGRINPGTGYREIKIDYRTYQGHRLAFLYVLGRWPTAHVDHKLVGFEYRKSNVWSDLREATPSQNHANVPAPSRNRSGVKGVCQHENKWLARIMIDGKVKYLGRYDKLEDAAARVQAVRLEHFGEYAKK